MKKPPSWMAVAVVLALPLVLGLVATVAPARATGLTYGNDDLRSGWYPDEPNLSPGLVGGGTFGQEFSTAVDGSVYAQPLVADNTLLVATETNTIYGLDPRTGAQRWHRNVGTPWNPADLSCGDISPSVGITGTPVVDPTTDTMYFLDKTYASGDSGPAAWYAHAVDITTGAERAHFPVLVRGTAANDRHQVFDATHELERPGLLLLGGVVYAAFGAHCDRTPYQGWVVGVSTRGSLTTLWTAEAGSGDEGGIWQSGSGLVSDGPGQILLATGNGKVPSVPTPGKTPPQALGQAVVRLAVQGDGSLRATDFFTPYDAQTLNGWDADVGAGGPAALPPEFGTPAHPHLLVEVGKQGYVYLLDRDNLGGMSEGPSGGDAALDRVGPDGGVWGRPSAWPGDGGYVYITTASAGNTGYGTAGALHAYKYGLDGTGRPTLSLVGHSADAFGLSSSPAAVSSDGTTSGSALVWVVYAPSGTGVGAQLRAYDPVPVNGILHLVGSWPIGTSSKFTPPTIDRNEVYVGTRDGHVLGFGSPISTPMTGSALRWAATTVGHSSVQTATLTAESALTVTGLSTGNPDFVVSTTTPALPTTLAAGRTLSVPVTFTPSAVGQDSAALNVSTSIGSTSIALTGSGQSAAAQISASPTVVSFGGVPVQGNATSSVTFSDTGAQPLTVQGITAAAAPFHVTGLPAVGAVLQPGTSVTATASFSPVATGTDTGQVSLATTAGTVSVALSGSASRPPLMTITPERLNFGSVPVGTATTASFTVADNGGSPLMITKSKPPVAAGGFTATTALAEGSTIPAGGSVTETVRFAPTSTGPVTDSWTITGDDGSGQQVVTFTGSGATATSIPSPVSGGWTLNGSSTLLNGTLQLTAANTGEEAGSAFWPLPVSSTYLDVAFDAAIDSGDGADGLTLALADPSRGATPSALGADGGGLGWSGIPGLAVALDTYMNGSDPSDNFVGVATGYSAANPDNLIWQTTTTSVPPLRNTVRHVEVVLAANQLAVSVDGVRVLLTQVDVGPTVLLGFTGANGGHTDRHAVSDVAIVTAGGVGVAVPPAPTRVAAVPGNGRATVSWHPPRGRLGPAVTSYTVTAAPGGRTVTVPGSATSAVVTGLTDATPYTFTVVATNAGGNSPASSPSAPVTPSAGG